MCSSCPATRSTSPTASIATSRCCSTSRPTISTAMTSFEAYAASKARLFEMQSRRPCRGDRGRATSEPGDADQSRSWPLPGLVSGRHATRRLAGAAGAAQCPECRGGDRGARRSVSPTTIETGLRTYPGLPHRMERVAEQDGILFVNDSKATNPDSDRAGARRLPVRPLDRRRARQDRGSGAVRGPARPCPRRLYDRRGGADVRAVAARAGCRCGECELLVTAVSDAAERRAGGRGGAALAGLRLVRPVPRL